MSQEITVLAIIDTEAALAANSLEGNIYFIDNLRKTGSTGVGTSDLNSMANSSHWATGEQAYEPLFNWLVFPLNGVVPTLPRDYIRNLAKANDNKLMNYIKISHPEHTNPTSKTEENSDTSPKPITNVQMPKLDFVQTKIRAASGEIRDAGMKLIDREGSFVQATQPDLDYMNHILPRITAITGEAVDKGVLFPAQYGTPLAVDNGWYFSATVSSAVPGIYSYTLHITLYKLEQQNENEYIWEPMCFTHDLKITVVSNPMINGFTWAGLGYLPLPLEEQPIYQTSETFK
jgi:hypothetical protein